MHLLLLNLLRCHLLLMHLLLMYSDPVPATIPLPVATSPLAMEEESPATKDKDDDMPNLSRNAG